MPHPARVQRAAALLRLAAGLVGDHVVVGERGRSQARRFAQDSQKGLTQLASFAFCLFLFKPPLIQAVFNGKRILKWTACRCAAVVNSSWTRWC